MRIALACLLLLPAIACADTEAKFASVKLEGVPHVRQKPDFCGEACVEMVARWKKADWTQNDFFNASGLDPSLCRGVYAPELGKTLKKIGFKSDGRWTNITRNGADKILDAEFQEIIDDLKRDVPSIVCMHYGPTRTSTEHFRLVLGYDAKTNEVLYHEPAASIKAAYRRMMLDKFYELWPIGRQPRQVLIRMPLEIDKFAALPSRVWPTNADLVQEAMKVKAKMPEGFHLIVKSPFIVVGNEAPRTVNSRAENTVAWAVAQLRKLYFNKNPTKIVSIWLFKDKKSYRKWTKELFNDTPTTPYGYYSPRHRALVMNISTGGGTLVHEIVHPFMDANFPKCPSWFNEGLASLYEQSSSRRGVIIGLTNWRLPGLQRAIKDGKVKTLKELTSTTTPEFYGEGSGLHYAMARYLCQYLQDRGLLVKYYHEFVKNHKDDPTGYKTLQKVLEVDDMDVFQLRWQKWVMLQRFR